MDMDILLVKMWANIVIVAHKKYANSLARVSFLLGVDF